MKKNIPFLILVSLASLGLSACKGSDQENYFGSDESGSKPPPLADNPPISSDDLDAIVEEENSNKSKK